jgi:hypothetical protein
VQLNSGGTVTYSTQTFTVGTQVGEFQPEKYARLVTSGQSAAGDFAKIRQSIEDVRTFAGSTITVSFWAKAASGTPKMTVELNQTFGSGGSPSAEVNNYAGQVTLTTSWARYAVTIAVPSISGKTIGTTANTSSLQLDLWTSSGTTYNTRSGTLGIQNNTFDIWGVQVEEGSVATAFERRPLQQELAMCQRYFLSLCTNNDYPRYRGHYYSGAGVNEFSIPTPVTMRTLPTFVGVPRAFVASGGGGNALSSVGIVSWGPTAVVVNAVLATGGDNSLAILTGNAFSAEF